MQQQQQQQQQQNMYGAGAGHPHIGVPGGQQMTGAHPISNTAPSQHIQVSRPKSGMQSQAQPAAPNSAAHPGHMHAQSQGTPPSSGPAGSAAHAQQRLHQGQYKTSAAVGIGVPSKLPPGDAKGKDVAALQKLAAAVPGPDELKPLAPSNLPVREVAATPPESLKHASVTQTWTHPALAYQPPETSKNEMARYIPIRLNLTRDGHSLRDSFLWKHDPDSRISPEEFARREGGRGGEREVGGVGSVGVCG